jgi:mono/diheme cytochrome c family protein
MQVSHVGLLVAVPNDSDVEIEMKRLILALAAAAFFGLLAFLLITRPQRSDPADFAQITADPARGELVFHAAGCASCHAAPGAEGEAKLVLAGGLAFKTAFGTFHAPNISPDPAAGIGGWTVAELDSAMRHGTSPDGRHYYPAFPFTSYIHATRQDVADLHAFLMTLPASASPSLPHDLGFPFNQRILLGGWKVLFLSPSWVVAGELTPAETRGRYLVEGLGHCGECHTPRNALGGREMGRWLAGGPNPDGPGQIPNITPGVLAWTAPEIAEYLLSGFTPEFDSVGGSMADVVTNLARLPASDREAIAAYLKRVPAHPAPAVAAQASGG